MAGLRITTPATRRCWLPTWPPFAAFLPDVEFTIVSQDPAWSATQYNADAIARIGFEESPEERLAEVTRNVERWTNDGGLEAEAPGRQAIESMSFADALWISGGGNLRSTWPEHIWERAALLRIAGCLSKPALITGQTLGPEFTARERELLGELLPKAAFVGVRERPSLGQALSLGVPLERLHYQLDDAVFMTPKPVALEWDSGQPWIAVTLAPFEGSLQAMARELASVAQATGAQLVFVPHVNAPPENGHRSDQAFAEQIAGELAKLSTPARVLPVFTAEEVYWLTGQASMVISSRYHPVVFGLALGKPALGIYTDEYTRTKIRGALAHAGRAEEWSIPFHVGLAGALSRHAIALWNDRQAARAYLESLHGKWRQQEQETVVLLDSRARRQPRQWRKRPADRQGIRRVPGRHASRSPSGGRGSRLAPADAGGARRRAWFHPGCARRTGERAEFASSGSSGQG